MGGFQIGPLELIVVLAIALIVLGPKKLPEVGRSIGNGMREFKESLSGERRDEDRTEVESVERQTGLEPRGGMEFAPQHIEEIVAHARDEAPNEGCGLLARR